jgi:hypothetical protein
MATVLNECLEDLQLVSTMAADLHVHIYIRREHDTDCVHCHASVSFGRRVKLRQDYKRTKVDKITIRKKSCELPCRL